MNAECVRLSVPAKTEYLVTARLVAASVAGRAGFHVDDIDDVKTACSEACLLLLQYTQVQDDLSLVFFIEGDASIRAVISAPHHDTDVVSTHEQELSGFLLEALMDEVAFSNEDGIGVYRLYKKTFSF